MDEISQLLRMARLEATLDTRCLLGDSTIHEPIPRAPREIPFHVLLEGECIMEIDGTLYPMTAGDVVIITSGSPHRILTAGEGPTRSTTRRRGTTFAVARSEDDGGAPVIDLFCGHYTIGAGAGAILFGSLPAPTQVSLFRSEGGRVALTRLSEFLRSEADRDGAGSAAIMSALCIVLIALVLRTNGTTDAHSRLWTAVSDPRLSQIIQNIVAKPEGHWSIERLSTEMAMSRATFIRRFQASTGMTFGQFVTRVRLMSAADLLVNSDQKIARIAAQIGYKSESAFTRAFRAATGESPSRFRVNQHEGPSAT
jgi:AraC-like DNA-binding protein